MRKIILFILITFCIQFIVTAQNNENIVVVEILDETLDQVYYDKENFDQPTQLVFPNLTSVSGYVYFSGNDNLVAVDFPMLTTVGDYVYIDSNIALETINAPVLETIHSDLYISSNTSLIELNICNLSQILQHPYDYMAYDTYLDIPDYYIKNNTDAVDAEPFCFSQGAPGNLTLSNTTIVENAAPNTVIGVLSAESNTAESDLKYYLIEDIDFFTFELFDIVDNTLVSLATFDYESQNEYEITIGVYNQLGEKTIATFTITIEDVANEDVQVIEILDNTLDQVYYDRENFTEPTILVFPNLTSVSGYVYFDGNVNLVSVEFPMLTYIGDYVYFSNNEVLETINAPVLETIHSDLYVEGNTSLTVLNICNLSQILPFMDESYIDEPYTSIPEYYIKNNTEAVDAEPFCFSQGAPGNLTLSNATVVENATPNTVIGDLTAEGSSDLTYYLVDDGAFFIFELFDIVDNTLVSLATFDYERQNEYEITIGVFNQLGEKTEATFTITIEDVANENIQVIEILEDTLENVFYSRENFTQPTQLVFPNLTTVLGYVYFDGNVNLVSVEFPMLTYVGDYTYFDGNEALESVDAPVIETIHDYLYVSRNTSLVELNICNLSYIIPSEYYMDPGNPDYGYYIDENEPYYYIEDNPVLDFSSTCLENTDISFNEEETLVEMPKILVGSFEANTDEQMSYFIIEDEMELAENKNFSIEDNGLYLTNDISEYEEDSYAMTIGALRKDSNENTSLNQKIELDIEVDLSDKKLNTNSENSIASEYPFLNQFVDFENCNGTSIEIYDFDSYVFAFVEDDAGIKMYGDFYDGVYCTGRKCIEAYNLNNPDQTWACDAVATPTCNDGVKNGDETGVDCGGNNCADCASAGDAPTIFENYPFLNNWVDYTNCEGISIEVFHSGNNNSFALITTNGVTKMYSDFYDSVYCRGNYCRGIYGLENPNETWACGTVAVQTPTCDDGIQNGDETGIDCGGSNCADCTSSDDAAIFVLYPFLTSIANETDCIEVYDFGHYVFAVIETEDGVKMYSDSYDEVYCKGSRCREAYELENATVTWRCNGTFKTKFDEFKIEQGTSFKLYPNPANQIINIQLDNEEMIDWSWKIVGALGKTLLEGTTLQSNNRIDITTFENGLYFMIAFNESGKMYKEPFVVVQH